MAAASTYAFQLHTVSLYLPLYLLRTNWTPSGTDRRITVAGRSP